MSDYPNTAGTLIDIRSAGFAVNTIQAWLTVTYYVGFKSFKKSP